MFKQKIHISWLFLLGSPLTCLLTNAFSILRNRNPSYYSLGIALAITYAYFPVLWDVRSNFYRVYYFPEDGLNLYTGIISLVSNNLGFSYTSIIFGFSAITTLTLSATFSKHLDEIQANRSKVYFYISIALFITLFEYRQLVDLQKTTLAVAFFLAALSSEKTSYKYLFYTLSALIHPLMAPMIIFKTFTTVLNPSKNTILLFSILGATIGIFANTSLINLAINYQNILPSNVLLYFLIEDSKFSSSAVALTIKLIRLSSILTIFYVFLKYTNNNSEESLKKYSQLLLILCSFSLLISFNEIALERYYYATYAIAIYVTLKHKLRFSHMFAVATPILINILIHGLFTLNVIFSDTYEVYSNNTVKHENTLKIFYYPTPALVMFKYFGASDEYLKNFTEP